MKDFTRNGRTGKLKWSHSDEMLTVSGNGAMPNYSWLTGSPWFSLHKNIIAVIVGNGVTGIGEWAFRCCSRLTSVTVPDSVTGIGESAFAGCSRLTNVTVGWTTPISVEDSAFGGMSLPPRTLHVPAGTQALYRAAAVWKEFGTITEYE
jgi:hypothetical protein